MLFMSHQYPTLGKYKGKFCDNMTAHPNLSTRLFSLLFFFKNEVCMCKGFLILSCSSWFLEVGSHMVGE